MRIANFFILLIILSPAASSQVLSLEAVCDSVLSRNLNIKVAKLERQIAADNNTPGRAGALPTVSLNGVQQGAVVATKQEFFNGDTREANNAVNTNSAFSARLDWPVFQGFAVEGRKDQLQALQELGEASAQQKIESELYRAVSIYYEIQWRRERVKTLEEANKLSRQRQTLAEGRLRLGTGSRLEVLQSNSDLNADSSELLKELNAIINLKSQLLVLIGISPEGNIEIDTMGKDSLMADFASVFSQGLSQNRTLLMKKAELSRSMGAARTAKSGLYPSIGVFGEYNFVQSRNQVGILKSNQSLGPSFGISFRYFIFDGFNIRQDIRIAKTETEIAALNLDQARLEVQAAIIESYRELELQNKLIRLEEASLAIASDNLIIAEKQLQVGVITDLQFREVQQLYVATESRLANARYLASMAGLSLHYLSGGLLGYLK